jgi:hypothetical protein
MIDKTKPEGVYTAIASNLRDFGYTGISANMIQEIHEALNAGDETLPHGVIGMFAKDQIEKAQQAGFLA